MDPGIPGYRAVKLAAEVVLELLEALAYRKAGGSAVVMNMREPIVVSKAMGFLASQGVPQEDALAAVTFAEHRAEEEKASGDALA